MNYKELIKIVEKRLNHELIDCLGAVESNYKVCMISKDPIVTKFIIKIMKDKNTEIFEVTEISDINLSKHCITNCESNIYGNGFVIFRIPDSYLLVESIDQAIVDILEFYKLRVFKGFFDEIVKDKLKNILIEKDLSCFIDAAINYAFLAGTLGDEEKGKVWLNEFLKKVKKNNNTADKQKTLVLEDAFECLLSAGVVSPHDLKAILGYFVVNRLKMNYTKGSKLLRISRTTLHEYMRKAASIGLDDSFFEKEFCRLKERQQISRLNY